MKRSPNFYREMAQRRGLAICKAESGGWYVTPAGGPWPVLYCAHAWEKVVAFVKRQPIAKPDNVLQPLDAQRLFGCRQGVPSEIPEDQ